MKDYRPKGIDAFLIDLDFTLTRFASKEWKGVEWKVTLEQLHQLAEAVRAADKLADAAEYCDSLLAAKDIHETIGAYRNIRDSQ